MAYVKKINGYVIRDEEAHTELSNIKNGTTAVGKATADASGNVISTHYATKDELSSAGKLDNVQISGTNLTISNKAVNIATDGTYNASTNKIATVSTVDDAISTLINAETADNVYNSFKELNTYITEHGTEAAGMLTSINQNSTDIDNLETAVDSLSLEENYDATNEHLEFELGNGGTSTGSGYKNAKWVSLSFTTSGSGTSSVKEAELPIGTAGTVLLVSAYCEGADVEFDSVNIFLPDKSQLNSAWGISYINYSLCGYSDAIYVAYNDDGTAKIQIKATPIALHRAIAVLFNE